MKRKERAPFGFHSKAQLEPSKGSVRQTVIPARKPLFQTTTSALTVRWHVQSSRKLTLRPSVMLSLCLGPWDPSLERGKGKPGLFRVVLARLSVRKARAGSLCPQACRSVQDVYVQTQRVSKSFLAWYPAMLGAPRPAHKKPANGGIKGGLVPGVMLSGGSAQWICQAAMCRWEDIRREGSGNAWLHLHYGKFLKGLNESGCA